MTGNSFPGCAVAVSMGFTVVVKAFAFSTCTHLAVVEDDFFKSRLEMIRKSGSFIHLYWVERRISLQVRN